MFSYPGSISYADALFWSSFLCSTSFPEYSSFQLSVLSEGIICTSSLAHLPEIGSSSPSKEIFLRPRLALWDRLHSIHCLGYNWPPVLWCALFCPRAQVALSREKIKKKRLGFTQGFMTKKEQQSPAITFKIDLNSKCVRAHRYFRDHFTDGETEPQRKKSFPASLTHIPISFDFLCQELYEMCFSFSRIKW